MDTSHYEPRILERFCIAALTDKNAIQESNVSADNGARAERGREARGTATNSHSTIKVHEPIRLIAREGFARLCLSPRLAEFMLQH